MSPIPKTSFLVGTFFAVSYSKPALAHTSVFFLVKKVQNLLEYILRATFEGLICKVGIL